MRSRLHYLLVFAPLISVAACTSILGDFSVGSDDDGTGDGGNLGDGTIGGDGANPGDGAITDGGTIDSSDGAVPCGYLGEACCGGPFTACNPGTACVSNECRTNDVWALGTFLGGGFNNVGASVHFDGTAWRAGPQVPLSVLAGAEDNPYPTAIWSPTPGQFRGVSAGGYSFIYQPPSPEKWRECSATDSPCIHPSGNTYLWSVFGFDDGDFWIAGSNSMNHCSGSACVSTTTGLPGTWGQGTLTGTSSSDLWYPQFSAAYHYNGTTWTVTNSVQARAMYAAGPKDVWGGNDHLQHYDGTSWSPLYSLSVPDAGAAPFVYSMSGTASDDVWATGYTNNSMGVNTPFILHWDGTGTWKQVPIRASAGAISFLWAATRHQIFVIGTDTIYIGDGTTWTPQTLPPQADYDGAAFGPPGWGTLTGSGVHRP